jgi:hypothetical protein
MTLSVRPGGICGRVRSAAPQRRARLESRVGLNVDGRLTETVDALHVLDEHVLKEAIGFLYVRIVMTFTDVADLLQRTVAHHLPGFAKCLEGILGLASHHDIADQPVVIVRRGGVGEIFNDADRSADNATGDAGSIAELRLVLLEHSLVERHMGNVSRAQIAKALVIRLAFVILE